MKHWAEQGWSLTMGVIRRIGVWSIALAGLCWLGGAAAAQQPLDQQLDFGNVSDGPFAEPPDLPDGDVENLDQFNGYPSPDRAEALPPPDRLYAGTSSTRPRHRRRPR